MHPIFETCLFRLRLSTERAQESYEIFQYLASFLGVNVLFWGVKKRFALFALCTFPVIFSEQGGESLGKFWGGFWGNFKEEGR